MRHFATHDDAFGVGVGDLVGTGSDENQWIELLRLLSSSAAERPYYLIPGNHDYDGFYDSLQANFYRKYISKENYFDWTYNNAAFIALDPNEFFPIDVPENSAQYRWLIKTLRSENWQNATWRFIFFHQPMYSQGWAGYSGERSLRKLLEPLIEKFKVDFIVSGHTHDYERLMKMYGTQRTTFVVTGGGGGSLEPAESSAEPKMDVLIKEHHYCRFYVSGNQVTMKVFNTLGKVIDEVVIVKG